LARRRPISDIEEEEGTSKVNNITKRQHKRINLHDFVKLQNWHHKMTDNVDKATEEQAVESSFHRSVFTEFFTPLDYDKKNIRVRCKICPPAS